VTEYCAGLARLGTVVSRVPHLRVVRDPADDMILACAIAAKSDYLVSRDDDLLSLKTYERIAVVSPEEFHRLLRSQPSG